MRFAFLSLIVVVTSTVVFADGASSRSIQQVREINRAQYDQVYPYYVQACSMTALHRLDGSHGGPAGHAVAYVKGLCRDVNSPYPKVKVCEPGQYSEADEKAGLGFNDIHNPNAGLGFSANKDFKNVNWVAIPGKDLFFNGEIAPNDTVKTDTLKHVRERLYTLKTHTGIKFKSDTVGRPWNKTSDPELFAAGESVDTDAAFTLARTVHCVYVPVKPTMLPRIARYLNGLNDLHFKAEDYDWNILNDNCAHLVDNLLAAVGFARPRSTAKGLAGYLNKLDPYNLAAPSVSMVAIASIANEGRLDDYRSIDEKPQARLSLKDDHWLATQHGSLIDVLDAHAQATNQVYKVGSPNDIFMQYVPVFKQYAAQISVKPEYTDMRANLEYFKGRYAAYQAPHDLNAWSLSGNLSEIANQVQLYVSDQLADVQDKLKRLADLR